MWFGRLGPEDVWQRFVIRLVNQMRAESEIIDGGSTVPTGGCSAGVSVESSCGDA